MVVPRAALVAIVTCAALAASCGSSSSSDKGGSVLDTDGGGNGGSGGADSGSTALSSVDAGKTDAGGLGGAPSDASTGASDASAADGSSSADASAGSCTPPGYSPAVTSLTPGTVTATVEDTANTPIAKVFAAVNGLDIGITGMTDTSGAVSLTYANAEKNPALLFGDGDTYGEFALAVTRPGQAFGTVHTVALPSTGATLTPGTDAASGPFTLTLESGTVVSIDTLAYPTPAEQELRVAAMPIAQAAVDPTVGLELVFGVAPIGTLFCPPAKLRVTNSASWAAGSAVDVYALGLDVGQAWAPYGEWFVLATAHVTSDGSAIETDDGSGLTSLTTLGLKRHSS